MSTGAVTNFSAFPPVTRRVRAYFAPVDRVHQQASIFDPAQEGQFLLDAPPAPWIDLGWIENFARTSTTSVGVLNSGVPSIAQYQIRETIGATVSFRFKCWSKLTMALAAGSQHMNLLRPANGSAANGSGAKGVPAVAIQSGSTATMIVLNASSAQQFSAGSMNAVDVDYAGQIGFVGSGVSAGYVRNASAVNNDPDYVRRVTFNVARVLQVSSGNLQLAQPLIAGIPAATMKVQPILGFVDREGGSFFQEWSALFVMPGEQGDRVLFYYPRLQAMQGAQESADVLVAPLERVSLNANFRALPASDANDGEQVVCFRSFLPSAMALL
jgi:hypothetical protein